MSKGLPEDDPDILVLDYTIQVADNFTGTVYFKILDTTERYVNGKLHCEDGPAAQIHDGSLEWYFNNELHRIGGPAIENSDGRMWYYVYGEPITDLLAYDLLVKMLKLKGLT